MRTGEEERVSTPVSTPSGQAKPRSFRSIRGRAPPQGVGHRPGQTPVQLRPGHPGAVGGPDAPRPLGGLFQEEVLHPLGGGIKVPAPQLKGRVLPLLLEAHPGQGVGAEGRKVLRTHPHQEAAVDVLPVPGPVAHAVGHHLPRAEAAATTSPPGHTQKVKADRPVGRWQASL